MKKNKYELLLLLLFSSHVIYNIYSHFFLCNREMYYLFYFIVFEVKRDEFIIIAAFIRYS